jgi:hypothetical protein
MRLVRAEWLAYGQPTDPRHRPAQRRVRALDVVDGTAADLIVAPPAVNVGRAHVIAGRPLGQVSELRPDLDGARTSW